MHIDQGLSDLIRQVYLGAIEDSPWETLFTELREQLGAHTVSMLLRPPGEAEQVAMLTSGGRLAEIESYNRGQFVLDPFVNLPAGQVVTLHEVVTTEALLATEFYQVVMQPQGWYDFLGADLREEGSGEAGLDVRFRVGRYRGARRFGGGEKQLVEQLLPHLQAAIRIYNRLHRLEKERALYAGAMGQLSVATVILDEDGKVLSTNPLADQLLAKKSGLTIKSERLLLTKGLSGKEFRERIDKVLAMQRRGETVAVEALRVSRGSAGADFGLVIRALPGGDSTDGASTPAAAIFISDPESAAATPASIISQLFDCTPSEAELALLLTNGLSLEEASQELGVSMNTSRTHLRALFAKTGVNRQAALVRLILKSVAALA